MEFVYSFLRTFVYVVFCVVNFVLTVCVSLRRNFADLKFKCFGLKNELEFVSRETKLFKKVPCHMVLILGNEEISYKDLAKITTWCIAARISYISFYDYTGKLKKKEADLYRLLLERNKEHHANIVWGKKSPTNGVACKSEAKNGTVSHTIQVNIFSYVDGKESIVDITKKICYSVLEGKLKSSDVTQNLIDQMLQAEFGVPDPDLGVCCGPVFSTFGLLPWQIRVTEFLPLPTHHNPRVSDFVELLRVYSRCEQRLGK